LVGNAAVGMDRVDQGCIDEHVSGEPENLGVTGMIWYSSWDNRGK
jgi:hypothetical protein